MLHRKIILVLSVGNFAKCTQDQASHNLGVVVDFHEYLDFNGIFSP